MTETNPGDGTEPEAIAEKPITWEALRAQQPGDAERAALQTSLVGQARTVQRNGWDDYRHAWSNGEVAGVAYLLGDTELLAELDETEGTVLSRFAGDLFGFNGAGKDIKAGLPATQAWFAAARAQLRD
ncbi:hypothetical protein ACLMAL_38535 [Nocardia sp. CWNU-33]|uniref:hypothetical protein n=1 Tax=Nocardia sp. CWNU-33 TaxID=3392117 RepID=UPI00398E5473